jgi:hypothetical protein
MEMKVITGKVVARKCGCCNHHEIGLETYTGEYYQLEPGDDIHLFLYGGEIDARISSRRQRSDHYPR